MKSFSRAFVTLAMLALISSAALAQNREKFGISAKAGGVNALVGKVMVTRHGQPAQLLTSTDDLENGDVVTTSSLSNVEVLLNPGSYLRVAENSEFEFQDGSLENLRVKLVKGSAIVEVTGVDDMKLDIAIAAGQANFTIIRSGVYRINAQANSVELAVRKGRAVYGPNPTDVVKGGNEITITNGVVSRAKLINEKDNFEVWSKERAKFLARANDSFSTRAVNGYLATMSTFDRFSSAHRYGLWTYNARAGCYTFLPFFYGWASPYGHYYSNFYWAGFGGFGGCCGSKPNSFPNIFDDRTATGTGGGSPGVRPPGISPGPVPPPPAIERGNRVPRDSETGTPRIWKLDP